MTKKELQKECGDRGIVYGGLDKKELVKRLKEHEVVEGSEYEEIEDDVESSEDRENEERENGDAGKNDGEENADGVSDGKLKLLLLKAEQRRFQMEKERIKMEKEKVVPEGCPDKSAQDNWARTIGRGQFGAKYDINFIENSAFIHQYFSRIRPLFQQNFLTNLASISATLFSSIWLSFQRYFFINPASVSAVYFHQSRSISSSIPIPFQQYFFHQ